MARKKVERTTTVAQTKVERTMTRSRRQLHEGTEALLREYDGLGEDDKVNKIEQDLLGLARNLYPSQKVAVYVNGSRLTGLAKSSSDVDIYVDIGDTFGGSIAEDKKEQADRVRRFANAMMKRTKKYLVFMKVVTARVPILKFRHTDTDLLCDLSFRSGMSTKNSELVKFYLDWDPRVKYVVAGVKYWMEVEGFAGPSAFTSYTQVWLALFFLMQKGIGLIPPLLKLRILATQRRPLVIKESMVEFWDCTVPKEDVEWKKKWVKKRKCTLTAQELLEEFFDFYSNLSLSTRSVLTTYNGMVTQRKRIFTRPRRPIRDFCDSCRTKNRNKKFRVILRQYKADVTNRFYLQDPFHQVKNLTKMANTAKSIEKATAFVECCKLMARDTLKRLEIPA